MIHKEDFWLIARKLRPDLTYAEFEAMWESNWRRKLH